MISGLSLRLARRMARFICRAVLRLENDNAFDPNAVSVEINGLKVGYLDKSYAALLRHELAVVDIDSFDCTDGHCDALIRGGGPEKTFLGVWLDLPDLID